MFRLAAVRVALALVLIALVTTRATAATITLVGGANDLLNAEVHSFGTNVVKNENPNPVPGTKTVTATLDRTNVSSITADLSNSAFVITFNQVADISRVQGLAHLFFMVSEDVKYTITGSFGVDGATFGQTLGASLTEQISGQPSTRTLYNSLESHNTSGATTFTLASSDNADPTLHPGVSYALTALAGFEAPTDPAGSGYVTRGFAPVGGGGGTNPVPLPPALFAGLACAGGLGAWRKCRGRA
jgi:hypothetical protein